MFSKIDQQASLAQDLVANVRAEFGFGSEVNLTIPEKRR